MDENEEQRIIDLEEKVRTLERKVSFLEEETGNSYWKHRVQKDIRTILRVDDNLSIAWQKDGTAAEVSLDKVNAKAVSRRVDGYSQDGFNYDWEILQDGDGDARIRVMETGGMAI